MDPETTLKELLDAFEQQDLETVKARASQLKHWLSCGGFVPKCEREDWVRLLVCLKWLCVVAN